MFWSRVYVFCAPLYYWQTAYYLQISGTEITLQQNQSLVTQLEDSISKLVRRYLTVTPVSLLLTNAMRYIGTSANSYFQDFKVLLISHCLPLALLYCHIYIYIALVGTGMDFVTCCGCFPQESKAKGVQISNQAELDRLQSLLADQDQIGASLTKASAQFAHPSAIGVLAQFMLILHRSHSAVKSYTACTCSI